MFDGQAMSVLKNGGKKKPIPKPIRQIEDNLHQYTIGS
jgi:hypothetical protein